MSELEPGTRYRIMGQVTLAVDTPSPQGRMQIEINGAIIPPAEYYRFAITLHERELGNELHIFPEQWNTDTRMLLLIEDETRQGAVVITNMDDARYLVPRRHSQDPEMAAIEIKWSGEWKMDIMPQRYPG